IPFRSVECATEWSNGHVMYVLDQSPHFDLHLQQLIVPTDGQQVLSPFTLEHLLDLLQCEPLSRITIDCHQRICIAQAGFCSRGVRKHTIYSYGFKIPTLGK